MVAYTDDGDHWYLGVISRITYRSKEHTDPKMNKYEGQIQVHQWKGRVVYDENNCAIPAFFRGTSVNDIMDDLTMVTMWFSKRDHKFKLCFLNQICGTPPNLGSIRDDIINEHDGCLQCSKNGPDSFPTRLPTIPVKAKADAWLTEEKRVSVTSKDTGQPLPFYYRRRSRCASKKECIETNRHAMVSVCVVTGDWSGQPSNKLKPMPAWSLLHLPPLLKDAYIVPDPVHMVNHETRQRMFIIDKKGYAKLKNSKPIPLNDVNTFLGSIAITYFYTICVNQNSFFDYDPRCNNFSQIFAGEVTPDYSNFTQLPIKGTNLVAHIGLLPANETEAYQAISTVCNDPVFQAFKVTASDIRHLNNAFGTKGSFPSRTSTINHGHSTLVGKRRANNMSRNTPSCGPSKEMEWFFYRQTYHDIHLPAAMHLVNELAHTTYRQACKVQHLGSFLEGGNGMLGRCNTAIATVNFDTNTHVDVNDRLSGKVSDELIQKLVEVMDQYDPASLEHKRAKNYIEFISQFKASTPSTICYQFPGINPSVQVLQAFAFPTMRMCIRVENFMTHQFYSGIAQHTTCVPLFLDKANPDDLDPDDEGMVSFCSHEDVHVFAWGAGGADEPKTTTRRQTPAAPVRQSTESSSRVHNSVSESDPTLQVQNNGRDKLFDAVYHSPSKKNGDLIQTTYKSFLEELTQPETTTTNGIKNPDAEKCFINAFVSATLHTPKLIYGINKEELYRSPLCRKLVSIMTKLLESNRTDPVDAKDLYSLITPTLKFPIRGQQDVGEFALQMFEHIESLIGKENVPYQSIFRVSQECTSDHCTGKGEQDQASPLVNIKFLSGEELNISEHLTKQETKYYTNGDFICDVCKKKGTTRSVDSVHLSNADVVVFDVSRSEYQALSPNEKNGRSEKICTPIKLTEIVNIGEREMKLTSAIVHVGKEHDRGHYISVYPKDVCWNNGSYIMDDAYVYYVPDSSDVLNHPFIKTNVRMLFYQRTDEDIVLDDEPAVSLGNELELLGNELELQLLQFKNKKVNENDEYIGDGKCQFSIASTYVKQP